MLLLGGRRWARLAGEDLGRGFPEAGRGHCVRVDAVRLVARLAADAMAATGEQACSLLGLRTLQTSHLCLGPYGFTPPSLSQSEGVRVTEEKVT